MHAHEGIYDELVWQKGVKYWVIAVGCILLIGAMDRVGWLRWFRAAIEFESRVVQKPVGSFFQFLGSPIRWVKSGMDTQLRLADLEYRLEKTSIDKARLAELEQKNLQLESMLQVSTIKNKATLVAELVREPNRLLITAGQRSQIHEGQFVTDQHGVLIGKLIKVGQYMSQVSTPGEPSFKLEVKTETGTAKGILEYVGSRLMLTSVLQTEPLAVGDILVTSGLHEAIPTRLVVAQVVKLSGNASDPTKGAEVVLLAQLFGWAQVW